MRKPKFVHLVGKIRSFLEVLFNSQNQSHYFCLKSNQQVSSVKRWTIEQDWFPKPSPVHFTFVVRALVAFLLSQEPNSVFECIFVSIGGGSTQFYMQLHFKFLTGDCVRFLSPHDEFRPGSLKITLYVSHKDFPCCTTTWNLLFYK